MTALLPTAIVAAGAVALIFVAMCVAYQLRPERVFLRGHAVVKKHKGKTEQVAIAEIAKINYQFQAVVGFAAVWEFIERQGNVMTVDASAAGMHDVLNELELLLPGFSLEEFQLRFDAADVEDAIEVWRTS